jgi:hypothetical protein
VVTPPAAVAAVTRVLEDAGETVREIGRVIAGGAGVSYSGALA